MLELVLVQFMLYPIGEILHLLKVEFPALVRKNSIGNSAKGDLYIRLICLTFSTCCVMYC